MWRKVMQYAAGIGTTIIVWVILGRTVGSGLMPLMVAVGLGLMAYGLVDKRLKKGRGDNEPR
jgi:hypothetical protein